jgi:hypothetical protein
VIRLEGAGRAPAHLELHGGAVPEPASWALMLLGFGSVGGLVRRRRAALPLASA